MKDLRKKGEVDVINPAGFTFIYSTKKEKTFACLTILDKAGKLMNCFIGEKVEYSITQLLELTDLTLTVESEGESAPDEQGRSFPQLRIVNYARRV